MEEEYSLKSKKYVLVVVLLLALSCMFAIFCFSSQDSSSTNILSKNITRKIAGTIFEDYKSMDIDFQNKITNELNLFIRKTAHFSLYFFMSMLIYIVFALWKKRFFISGVISVSICCVYAMLDEFHQSFVPGRTPLVKDVIIDTSGAILGTVFCFMIISSVKFIIGNIKSHE